MGINPYREEFSLKEEQIFYLFLPVVTWKPVKGSWTNSADPDQTPHIVASDQSLHCLLTGPSIKIE